MKDRFGNINLTNLIDQLHNIQSMVLKAYTDASFNKNEDLPSDLAAIDGEITCLILDIACFEQNHFGRRIEENSLYRKQQ